MAEQMTAVERPAEPRSASRSVGRRFSVSLGVVGLIALLVSAWGGIIPFVGPVFGYSGDGSASWTWNLSHVVLGLIPGALGVLAGLSIMAARGDSPARGRIGLSAAGLVAVACGAWFVVGPVAWPVVFGTVPYFVPASPLTGLAHWIGYALGPGLILGMCGAFGLGWAARHDAPLGVSAPGESPATAPAERPARHAA